MDALSQIKPSSEGIIKVTTQPIPYVKHRSSVSHNDIPEKVLGSKESPKTKKRVFKLANEIEISDSSSEDENRSNNVLREGATPRKSKMMLKTPTADNKSEKSPPSSKTAVKEEPMDSPVIVKSHLPFVKAVVEKLDGKSENAHVNVAHHNIDYVSAISMASERSKLKMDSFESKAKSLPVC
jgi:hypothetical protein